MAATPSGSRTRTRGLLAVAQAAVVALAVQGAAAGIAAAGTEDRTDIAVANASHHVPADGLSFETSSHRAWYSVFWTGKCGELPFWDRLVCVKGRPSWPEVTRMVLEKAAPGDRPDLRDRMLRLGRLIGYEWARYNDERRIDTDDLERWSKWLRDSTDVKGAIERIANAAHSRLGAR